MDTFSDKYIQNAKEALLQGDYQAAEIWLREVVRKDLKNREAWVLLHSIINPRIPLKEFALLYYKEHFSNVGQQTTAPTSKNFSQPDFPREDTQPLKMPARGYTGNIPPAYSPAQSMPGQTRAVKQPTASSGNPVNFSQKKEKGLPPAAPKKRKGKKGCIFFGGAAVFLTLLSMCVIGILRMSDLQDLFHMGSASKISRNVLSEDGNWLAILDSDDVVSVWNLEERRQTTSFQLLYHPNFVKISPHGRYVIIIYGNQLEIRDSNAGTIVGIFEQKSSISSNLLTITDADVSPDGEYIVFTTSFGWYMRHLTNPFDGRSYADPNLYSGVAFSPAGKYVSIQNGSKKWKTHQFPSLAKTQVIAMDFTSDDEWVIRGGYSNKDEVYITSAYGSDVGDTYKFFFTEEFENKCSSGSAKFSSESNALIMSCHPNNSRTVLYKEILWEKNEKGPVKKLSVPLGCYYEVKTNTMVCRSALNLHMKVYHPGESSKPFVIRLDQVKKVVGSTLYAAQPEGDEQLPVDAWMVERVLFDERFFRNIRYETLTTKDGIAEVRVTYEKLTGSVWKVSEGTARLRLLQGKWNLDENSLVFEPTGQSFAAVVATDVEASQPDSSADPGVAVVKQLGGTLVYFVGHQVHVAQEDGTTYTFDPIQILDEWNTSRISSPEISSDGKGFYFVIDGNFDKRNGVYYASLDGKDVYPVAYFPYVRNLSISPDNEKFMVMSQYSSGAYGFYMDQDYRSLKMSDEFPNRLAGSVWSPDSQIAYQLVTDGEDFSALVALDTRNMELDEYRNYHPNPRDMLIQYSSDFSTDFPMKGLISPDSNDIIFPQSNRLRLIDTRLELESVIEDVPNCRVAHFFGNDNNTLLLMTDQSHIFYRYNIQTGERKDIIRLEAPMDWNCDEAYDWAP